MHSEFYNVSLDRIRYSLVWEGSDTLYGGLDIREHDQVLVITSAGCNVLNALLKNPRRVVAIDLNPAQNRLLLLKKHLIEHHQPALFRALMGFDGPERVGEAWPSVERTLPAATGEYWAAFFGNHPGGILTAGKLETYLAGFSDTLDEDTRQKLRQLIRFGDLTSQRRFFRKELHRSPFRSQFIRYFADENLSQGRDPRLFKYAQEPGGEAFYRRLVHQVSTTLVRDNFFFRFFLFGPQDLPEALLPPCYRRENHDLLRAQLPKLSVVDGEAVDYLLSAEGASVTKASLSNAFEYTSPDEFHRVCRSLLAGPHRRRFVFWNLLQEQVAPADVPSRNHASLSELLSRREACFYFRSVRVLETSPVPVKNANQATVCHED